MTILINLGLLVLQIYMVKFNINNGIPFGTDKEQIYFQVSEISLHYIPLDTHPWDRYRKPSVGRSGFKSDEKTVRCSERKL